MGDKFLSLNPSDAGPAAAPESKASVPSIDDSVFFTISKDPSDLGTKAQTQERDLRICQAIAEGLRVEGFDAADAALVKPWGASTRAQSASCVLVFWLTTIVKPGAVYCYLSTHTRPHTPSYYSSLDWAEVRAGIEKILRKHLKAESLVWMTENALENRELTHTPGKPFVPSREPRLTI